MVNGFFLAVLLLQISAPPDFLERIRILESRPAEGELTFADPEGEVHTLREGDSLPEAGGAIVENVSRTTLVLKRVVTGADGERGESLLVVRFDRSGKTKVREYQTVSDASRNASPPRNQ